VGIGEGKIAVITREKIAEWLIYDQETGCFFWRKSPCPALKIKDKAGEITNEGYCRIQIEGVRYLAHRLAWILTYNIHPPHQLDHINGEKSDNRIENLRLATNAENHRNVGPRKTNSSGFKGVSKAKSRKRWNAGLRINGKHLHLGVFDTVEDAHAAYCLAVVKHHGEFARTK
jgi:hypothetical protein